MERLLVDLQADAVARAVDVPLIVPGGGEHVDTGGVNITTACAGNDRGETGRLRRSNEVVPLLLFGGRLADDERTGHVGAITVDTAPDVDDHQITFEDPARPAGVVRPGRALRAAGDDGVVTRPVRTWRRMRYSSSARTSASVGSSASNGATSPAPRQLQRQLHACARSLRRPCDGAAVRPRRRAEGCRRASRQLGPPGGSCGRLRRTVAAPRHRGHCPEQLVAVGANLHGDVVGDAAFGEPPARFAVAAIGHQRRRVRRSPATPTIR